MDSLQQEIKEYLDERQWHNNSAADLAKSISIEAGELLEEFQWSDPATEILLADKNKTDHVRREVVDILIYSLEMCLLLGVDFRDVIKEKLDYAREKYPVAEVLGKSGNYHKIHQEYRQKGKF